jgi:SAM-dependent methyltransferase
MSHNYNALDRDATPGWRAYYAKAGLGPPRPTLLHALDRLAADRIPRGHAVDLGCGVGRDTLELLRRGWHVTAIDQEQDALDGLLAEATARGLPGPEPVRSRFEMVDLPPCHLVNASFALFFCPPDAFAELWRRVRAALMPGGRFAGQLLGPEDSWAAKREVTAHGPAELTAMLSGWAVERLEREETDSITPRGEAKRWDIWHLVLRRP